MLVRTATLLLVATYTDNMHPSVCVEAVEKLGKCKKNFHLKVHESYPTKRVSMTKIPLHQVLLMPGHL